MQLNVQNVHDMFCALSRDPSNKQIEDTMVNLRMDPCYISVLELYIENNALNNEQTLLYAVIELKNTVKIVWREHTKMGLDLSELSRKIFHLMFSFNQRESG